MSLFPVIIKDNQSTPVFRSDIGSQITGLSLETVLPGGCSDCSFQIPGPVNFLPSELYPLGFGYRVDIHDKLGVFWSGRIERVTAHRGGDGTYFTVSARGYGVNLSDQIDTTEDVSGLQTSQIIANVIASFTQQIDETAISASAHTLSGVTAITLDMMTPAQQIAWASKFANSADEQQLMYVYPSNQGSRILTFKPRPTTPDLYCSIADFEVAEFGFDGEHAANRIDILYNNGAATATANSTALQGAAPQGWGFTKTLKLIIDQITQTADADQVASAQLAIFSVLKMVATSLRCKANVQFLDANNQEIPTHRIRAGQLLQFRDVLPSKGITNLTYANSCLIIRTSWSEDGQDLSIIPESFESRLEAVLGRAANILEGVQSL